MTSQEDKNQLKVLFLDIDGPIAPFGHKKEDQNIPHIHDINPDKINLLKQILQKHEDFKIVIISDWRNALSRSQLEETFNHFDLKIYDVVKTHIEKDEAIELWLTNNQTDQFVIIDDDIIFDLDHDKSFHQIKPSLHAGLLPMHIEMFDEIVEDLNHSKK